MIEWNCKTVDYYNHEHNGHEQVIYNVHWRVTKKDEEYSEGLYGVKSLNTDNIQDFVPFEDVTSEIVEGWVKDAMGEEQVTQIETTLDQQIEDKKNPTSITVTLDN